jgi:hypothetical protein
MDRVADRLGEGAGMTHADDRKLSDQLARTRELKEEMNELQRQIQRIGRDAQQADAARSERGQRGNTPQGQSAQGSRPDATGRPGEQATGSGARGAQAGGEAQRELQQLRQQYAERMREAERLRQELGGQRNAGAGTTPEGQQMVTSAPGTEAFKQDFSRWEILHKDVTLGLEKMEASLSQALLERAARDRLKAGAADRAPDEYEHAVDAYFRSLAAPKP